MSTYLFSHVVVSSNLDHGLQYVGIRRVSSHLREYIEHTLMLVVQVLILQTQYWVELLPICFVHSPRDRLPSKQVRQADKMAST